MSPTRAADGLPEEVLSELCGLDSPGILREIVRSRAELLSPIAVEQLAEAVRQRVRVDVGQALRLADAAVAIARELSSAESLGRGFRAKANALWFNANFEGAVELFETAIAQFETAGRADEVGRTLSSSIQPLALLGRYEDASRAAERAREIFVQLGDTWRLARVELNAANLHHRQDRFAEALSG